MTLTTTEYRSLAEFRFRLREFIAFSEAASRAAGIEPRQHQLLLAVKGLPKGERPTIGFLSERLQLRHHSVVELVDRLVDRGFAARERGDEDARVILVKITPRGSQVLDELSLAHRREIRSMGPALVSSLRGLLEQGRKRTRS